MKFIDLFAGLGGFHIALEKLGHECVFASELKEGLAELYETNFGIVPDRDITKIEVDRIPEHDILCAGFPCQPFSKAGDRKGLKDNRNGSLFDRIADILECHKPSYFILENVRNLKSHDNGKTWAYIEHQLKNVLGYSIDKQVLSPHYFSIPQHRERFFIVGARNGLTHFNWPEVIDKNTSIYNYLDSNPENAITLEKEKEYAIDLWQELIDKLPVSEKMPSWPVWSMEFGATYPFENETPFAASTIKIGKSKGIYGIPLIGMSRDDKFKNLPRYARTEQDTFPTWKKHFIRSNRAFYERNKKYISTVVKKIQDLNVTSWQKFEWNVQGGERNIRNYIIQFRGSGIRIKKTDFFPSLVTVSTQIPILGWEGRYITKSEGARIQSLGDIKLPENIGSCFSALGNAVNSTIAGLVAEKLISDDVNGPNAESNEIDGNKNTIMATTKNDILNT